ncbi:MAG: Wzz/FepE/Etk N-terminal domain-containing protein [Chloroflexota bacterium]|nr:Wzz/FepE/Etk N-terminal domain-containing protein [Chloroflexota bacterium]
MELEQYVSVLKRWWWLMVACVVVASGSSYYGTTRMPRIYQATTTLIVGQTMQQPDPSRQDLYISMDLAQTYAEMVKRRPVLQSAAEALGLAYVPSAEDVSTRQVAGTQLLEIGVRDTDAERARVLADEIANQLILRSPSGAGDQERRSFVTEQLEDLQRKIETTEAEIEEEREKLEAANSARAIQQYDANINALEQKLSSYQSTYATMLTSAEGGTNYLSVIEPATTPERPISPNVAETVLLAAAIGLTLAVGGAFLIEYLDDTVKSTEDVERVTGLPILGAISRIGGDTYAHKLVAAREPRSPVAEAYRVLRTNIQFSSIDSTARTLMVTSPNPVEGKSVTLANLAVVMAQAGHRVVAVDTDLRRPVLHEFFNLPNSRGLSDAVLSQRTTVGAGAAGPGVRDGGNPTPFALGSEREAKGMPPSKPPIMEYVRTTGVPNLWVLPSGPVPPNPAELLGSERLRQVVRDLRWADVILFDSPPALAVTDAVVLGARVDGVVVVYEAGSTRRDEAKRSIEELERVGANVLGVVMNQLSRGQDGYYYYHYYYGEDGKGKERGQGRSWLERLLPFVGRSEVEE